MPTTRKSRAKTAGKTQKKDPKAEAAKRAMLRKAARALDPFNAMIIRAQFRQQEHRMAAAAANKKQEAANKKQEAANKKQEAAAIQKALKDALAAAKQTEATRHSTRKRNAPQRYDPSAPAASAAGPRRPRAAAAGPRRPRAAAAAAVVAQEAAVEAAAAAPAAAPAHPPANRNMNALANALAGLRISGSPGRIRPNTAPSRRARTGAPYPRLAAASGTRRAH